MSITIRDVAAAAGVSPMAVSKVLHGRGTNVRVSEATAETIRRVAKDLKYRPNNLARNFRQQKTSNVGLVFQDMPRVQDGGMYFVQLIDGVTASVFPQGYSVTLCPKLVNFRSHDSLLDGRFDGLVWAAFRSDQSNLRMLESAPIPIVLLQTPPSALRPKSHSVCCDNEEGMRLAVEHLVGLGHRRILAVQGYRGSQSDEKIDRTRYFCEHMARHGIEVVPDDLPIWSEGAVQFREWWKSRPPHTALVALEEILALDILGAAQADGISVPEDLSVVSFDSTDLAQSTAPRLTSIYQPIADMASKAADLLLGLVRGEDIAPAHHGFPCRIDLRESTAAPRSTP